MTLFPYICLISLWAIATATGPLYTNQWMAEIHGGEEVAQRAARDLGYTYNGQISPFNDIYLLTRDDLPETAVRDSSHLTRTLEDIDEVKWAEQHRIVEWSRKGQLQERSDNHDDSGNSKQPAQSSQEEHGPINDSPDNPKEVGKGNFHSIPKNAFCTKPSEDSQLDTYTGVTSHVKSLSKKNSPYEEVFNDPLWHAQWYVQDYRVKEMPVMDHNVVSVYKMGYTGKGITVMIADNGIEHDHRDLVGNFDESLSFDYCLDQPGCQPGPSDFEGTESAGIIAMVANNHKCGVGIAFKAKVAGAKVICPRNIQYIPCREAKGLVHELEKVDIYSNSWGIVDDGMSMEKVCQLTATAIDKGIKQGRNGKGAIYFFPAGNGKHIHDNCGADGLANYMGTIAIGSADQYGKATYYGERCPAIFATAYTGDPRTEMLVSTSLNGDCTTSGVGTAYSVSIAAGIIALALDAKSDLTYRDIMHLIAWSSEVAPLADNEDSWNLNGRGLWVSNDFGFGLLNAENMVTLAKHWDKVPKQITCTKTIVETATQFYVTEGLRVTHEAKPCQDHGIHGIHFIEHVEVTSTINYAYRGAISITIKSPSGTKTTLLESRKKDSNNEGLNSWNLKSVHNWGEKIEGRWTVEVKIANVPGVNNPVALAEQIILTFHGTHSKPSHYNHARKYAAFRLPDGRTSHVQS